MAPSALGYVPTCNHCMTTHPPKPMGRKEQPGSCKELERGRAGLQKEEGKKIFLEEGRDASHAESSFFSYN